MPKKDYHTEHCIARMRFGDGACECGADRRCYECHKQLVGVPHFVDTREDNVRYAFCKDCWDGRDNVLPPVYPGEDHDIDIWE